MWLPFQPPAAWHLEKLFCKSCISRFNLGQGSRCISRYNPAQESRNSETLISFPSPALRDKEKGRISYDIHSKVKNVSLLLLCHSEHEVNVSQKIATVLFLQLDAENSLLSHLIIPWIYAFFCKLIHTIYK